MDRDDAILPTRPLTTTLRTKLAMLRDWGSWDADFNAVTARIARYSLLDVVGRPRHPSWCRCRAARTFSVEAAVATLVPRDGHVLVLDNGAYCKRAAKLTQMMGRRSTVCCRSAKTSRCRLPARRTRLKASDHPRRADPLRDRPGSLNPLAVADVCAAHGKGPDRRRDELRGDLPIDARGLQFDALVAASRQVPRRGAGHGLRVHPQGHAGRLRRPARTWRWTCTTSTSTWKDGQWCHAAHPRGGGARTRRSPVRRGRVASRRAWRATPTTAHLVDGMARWVQAVPRPGGAGADHRDLPRAGDALPLQALLRRRQSAASSSIRQADRGRTFRVGCIGAIGRNEMQQAVNAVAETLSEVGIPDGTPAA